MSDCVDPLPSFLALTILSPPSPTSTAFADTDKTIILNAGGTEIKPENFGFYVLPVRKFGIESPNLYWDSVTKEIRVVTTTRRNLQEGTEGGFGAKGENYDEVLSLLLQETRQLKAAREQDVARMEKDSAQIKALKASREQDAARIAALEKKIDALLSLSN